VLWILELLLRIALAAFAVAFSLFWGGIFASTDLVWLTATSVGAAVVLLPLVLSGWLAPRLLKA
jgi:hypothetical protein